MMCHTVVVGLLDVLKKDAARKEYKDSLMKLSLDLPNKFSPAGV